jgi:lactate racemase
MNHSVSVLTSAWYGDSPLILTFPSSWDVVSIGLKNIGTLKEEEIEEGIKNPIGCNPLRKAVKDKERIVIIVDDLQRPTPLHTVLPLVIKELRNGGVGLEKISMVMATACHRPATIVDFAKKVGQDIAKAVRTISHNGKDDLVYLGNSSQGTPIYVNRWVAEADFRIAIGGVYPHERAGFGGGSKLIHPGVCGIETARHLHNLPSGKCNDSTGNSFRKDIEEVAEKVGLDFSINVLLNQERDIGRIFAGDRRAAFLEAIKTAEVLYAAEPFSDTDIVITNTYPFDTSLHFISKGTWPLNYVREGGSKVVIASCPEGLGFHGLSLISLPGFSGFIRRLRALSRSDIRTKIHSAFRKNDGILFLSPNLTRCDTRKIYPHARLFQDWESLLKKLYYRHNMQRVRVAVYNCAPLMFPQQSEPRLRHF